MVDHLVARKHDVIVIDNLSTGQRTNLNTKAELVFGSILDKDLAQTVTEGADWVFHLAAWPRVPRSIEDPLGTHQVNVDGTLNMLQATRENGVKKFIYSSSSSIYGDQSVSVMSEDMAPNPKSPYALHKLIGEQYSTMFARLFDITATSLRYFNVYGARQPTEGAYGLIIPRFLKLKNAGEPLTIYGDGKQTRSYSHVSDVARANVMVAEANLVAGENTILNIGSHEEISVNEIARKIGGDVVNIIPNPRGELEERRKSADHSKAKSLLGWEPSITFEDGLQEVMKTK